MGDEETDDLLKAILAHHPIIPKIMPGIHRNRSLLKGLVCKSCGLGIFESYQSEVVKVENIVLKYCAQHHPEHAVTQNTY
mmetsp:Transcript_4518/g.8597  ORF Transcript_4518/g.8597 Transcript_4518/m.8597 type:complete len:80 (-) Transcript_4518:53-292(-)